MGDSDLGAGLHTRLLPAHHYQGAQEWLEPPPRAPHTPQEWEDTHTTLQLLQEAVSRLQHQLDGGTYASSGSVAVGKKHHRISSRVLRWLFTLSAFWQLLTIFLLWVVDSHSASDQAFDIGAGVMLALQTAHLVLLIITSVKLVKQLAHGTASPWFLVQSYASTLLLFAGIYTLILRLDPGSFEGVRRYRYGGSDHGGFSAFEDFVVLLYFSTTCFTTVGFGDVHASSFASLPFVMLEMFFSVAYTVGIFGMGIAHFSTQATKLSRERERAQFLTRSHSFSSLHASVNNEDVRPPSRQGV